MKSPLRISAHEVVHMETPLGQQYTIICQARCSFVNLDQELY